MSDDGFEDQEALEEHLEEVKPEPVAQEELDELVEPATELRPAGESQAESEDDEEPTPTEDELSGRARDGECGALDEPVEPETSLRPPGEGATAASNDEGDGDE